MTKRLEHHNFNGRFFVCFNVTLELTDHDDQPMTIATREKKANYKLKTEFLCYVQLKIPQSRKHAHVRIFFTHRLTKSHSGQCLYLKHGAHVCVRATNRHGGTCYTKPVQHDLCDVVMHKLAVWFALSLSYNLFFMLLLLEFCEWPMLSEWCDRPKNVFPPFVICAYGIWHVF